MPKFKIKYYFNGEGESIVEAKNKDEAEQKYYDGDVESDNEWGENYYVEVIEEVKDDTCSICGKAIALVTRDMKCGECDKVVA